MATTDAKALFVDTNILVYANVAGAPMHERALSAINKAFLSGRPLWLSRQVLREFIVVHTRPQTFVHPITSEVLGERLRYLEQRFQVADDTADVTHALIRLIRNFRVGGKQVHDANIVATMQVYGIPAILTHNIKDFERYGSLIQIETL